MNLGDKSCVFLVDAMEMSSPALEARAATDIALASTLVATPQQRIDVHAAT